MLRTEADNRFVAEQVRQPLFVAGRESVIVARNDVVEFVEGIAIGTPSLAFLVGVEEIAGAIKRERVGNANACRDRFELFRGDVIFLNRAPFAVDVVMRDAVLYAVRI